MKSDSGEIGPVLHKEALQQAFEAGREARHLAIGDIEHRVEQALISLHSHPTLKVRLKKFDSYYRKYLRLLRAGDADPHITDLMGVRIVCPFIEDLETTEALIKEHFEVIETERKEHRTFKEFGYESTHLLIKVPADIIAKRGPVGCDVVELQIRTILQDAWAEVEHELVYKAEFTPFDMPMKRKLAAVNASLSLADIIFQEIRIYQKELNSQLGRRRETFYQKIEEATDALLYSDDAVEKPEPVMDISPLHRGSNSIDDLLLSALYAHNKNQFDEANALYTRILALEPKPETCSLIYKHRGMAEFAQSRYEEAIADFTRALDLDKTYRIAYYRGVVYAVLKQYAEAIDDFTLSLEINPYQAFCLFRRGQAYYHIGDYPHALSDCEAALAMEPENEAIAKFRTLLQSKLKM